jgi:CRISPR-associated protein Csx10
MTTWHVLKLRVTPHSALSLGDESGIGNFLQTRQVITGASLRGAVAARALAACEAPAHKRQHDRCPVREDCDFWRIFRDRPDSAGAQSSSMDGEPRFGYAYPGKIGPAFPVPLTARTCKLYPGYPSTSDRDEGHGIYDALIQQSVYGLLSDLEHPFREELLPELGKARVALTESLGTTCPVEDCEARLQPAEGTYVLGDDGVPGYAGRPRTRRATHVGINRARGVAEDALLFTVETIDPAAEQISFYSRLAVPDSRLGALRPYLSGDYHVGRGRSRGLGAITLSVGGEQDVAAEAPLGGSFGEAVRDRVDDFNLAVRSALARYRFQDTRVPRSLPGTLFSVTLNSPAILEAFGQTLMAPTGAMLGLPSARLVRSWARTTVVSGWDAAARLPRRTRLAVQTGSAFLFWVPPDLDRDEVVESLVRLEVLGIGRERPRGYGQVVVCAPFHMLRRLDRA